MLTQQQAEELFGFFEKYVAAMHSIAQDEREKLNALLSNSLPRIEHAISTAQANAKQVESLEARRASLQASMGCAGMTLSELLGQIPDGKRNAVSALFHQLNKYVDQIKFTNDQSMEIAKANVIRMNPQATILQKQGEVTYSPSTLYDAGKSQGGPSIFKTTV